MTPLREIVDTIQEGVAKLEDDLKVLSISGGRSYFISFCLPLMKLLHHIRKLSQAFPRLCEILRNW